MRVALTMGMLLIVAGGAAPLMAQNPRHVSSDSARTDTTRADSGRRGGFGGDSAGGRGLAGLLGAALRPRLIGPAMISGRIVSIAVDPRNEAVIYVGAASGGVWKTDNGGATWTPIFDHEGSYSIGTVVLDPRNPSTVWVGTGENNSQRSVAYGDGVYRSDDAGRTWHRMGLENSEHIGRIAVDPRNSDVVYVAAQGPLWSDGGDRGLYKTTDGGKTWNPALTVSDRTGVTDVALDPRNPDIVLAATWQRRRHVWTLIDGGPESSLQRSTDGGKTWRKITSGLPGGQLGRIGIAISPADPDIVYATVEAQQSGAAIEGGRGGSGGSGGAGGGAGGGGGIFRSSDGGITWERRSDYTAQPMYYAQLVADPFNTERIYSMDVATQVSDDGGTTWHGLGERSKHSDNHALWVDPKNPDHYLNGNDGGLYQSWDRGKTWIFFANLPLGQFYDVDVDNAQPFYHICGGTQDNNSVCGPSETRNASGILNADWFVSAGGDGFVSRIDPHDATTVYAESQNGGMERLDLATGESVSIQPQEGRGDDPSRWNWDTPIIISPHSHTRLYTASQRLYRSDDRGDTWVAVSGDLTRKLDRNALPVMGKVWGPDAVAKNQSTAFYSNVSAIAESYQQEGLIYVGTDDGLIQITDDGGKSWRKTESVPGVPANTYVQRLVTSPTDARVVYAAFDNHQNGDFAPYLYRSADAGRTWTAISGDLPKHGTVYAIAQDQIDPKLLFAGTEFGAWLSQDGGTHWNRIPGLPTIQVRDIVVQRQRNALVLGTFGRGIYVIDNYSLARSIDAGALSQSIAVFPVSDATAITRRGQFGGGGKGNQGEALFTAANPPAAATIVYSLRATMFQSLRDQRIQAERDAERQGKAISYPTSQEFLAEADEEPVLLAASIADEQGRTWRILDLPATRGAHRAEWDLRGSLQTPADPVGAAAAPSGGGRGGRGGGGGFGGRGGGGGCAGCVLVPPGKYTVTIGKREKGIVTPLAAPVSFTVRSDPSNPLTPDEIAANLDYREKEAALSRQITEAVDAATTAKTRIDAIIRVLSEMPGAPPALHDQARSIDERLTASLRALRGDEVNAARGEQVPISIQDHIRAASPSGAWGPTGTDRQQYDIAAAAFPPEYARLRPILLTELPALEQQLEKLGAPATPGRIPDSGP
ncbi:MAG: WD40/YVTN/BNR-like repeat-containing protein [Gemmatimonadales bacterium]